MNEYHIQLEIEPETYDYGEEEIVYRLNLYEDPQHSVDNIQLISERSLPILNSSQKIIENFLFVANTTLYLILLHNINNKKCVIRKATINGITLMIEKQLGVYKDKFTKIIIMEYINNSG
jgi:hypothetical protein